MRKKIKLSPYLLIVLSFAIIIFIGSLLLTLPISSQSGNSLPYIQGLFTSTSAVTVTGLSINNINTSYTIFGQIIILVLIQLGGLGILTASSMIVLLISGKLDYYSKKVVREDINFDLTTELPEYLKKVVKIVFTIEFIGAVLLLFRFIKEYDFLMAVFYSIFHSVSAFCNAGFSLFTNSLIGYRSEIYVNLVISSLIILGGIGFSTLLDINNVRKKLDLKYQLVHH